MSFLVDPDETPFWHRLGEDEAGMPVHFPIGVNREGQGPEDDLVAHHITCWCGRDQCILAGALSWSFRLGQNQGLEGDKR